MESVEALVGLAVQGTMERAKICSLLMALSKLIGSAEIYSDNRGVVQALNRGQVECIHANHDDADLWIKVWVKVDGHKEQDRRLGVVWVKAHTSAKEEAQMAQQDTQIAMANDKAEERAMG